MAVTIILGTQLGREQNLKPLCRIEQEFIKKGVYGAWRATLHYHPRQWAKKHRMAYQLQIVSQWCVEMKIDDPRLATLFKLTWL